MSQSLRKEARKTLADKVNHRNAIALVEQYRSGNMNPGIGTSTIPGTKLSELRSKSGTRVVFEPINNTLEIKGICDKNNQNKVFKQVRKEWEENNK